MHFRVLKEFVGNGVRHERGSEIDIESTPKVQGLIDQRYLLPIDAAVAEVTQSPAAKTENGLVKRRKNTQEVHS